MPSTAITASIYLHSQETLQACTGTKERKFVQLLELRSSSAEAGEHIR